MLAVRNAVRVVALAAFAKTHYKAGFDLQKPNVRVRAAMPDAGLPWYGGQPASKPGRGLKSFPSEGELPPASLVCPCIRGRFRQIDWVVPPGLRRCRNER